MNIARYGSPRVHLPGEDGKPLCGRAYHAAPDYFKKVDKEADCGNCIKRRDGFEAQKAETAKQRAQREKELMQRLARLVAEYAEMTTPVDGQPDPTPAELEKIRKATAAKAITIADLLLLTPAGEWIQDRAEI